MEALEAQVLDPAIVEAAMEAALTALRADPTTAPASMATARQDLAALDGRVARLTQAVKLGTAVLPSLVKEPETVQRRRGLLAARVQGAEAPIPP